MIYHENFKMNYSDITIGIVTYKSESVIFNCLKSIKKIKKIIILDNSNDIDLKYKVNKKYPSIRFELSKKNLGYGGGNNSILKISKTPYVLILSPDTILKNDSEHELLKAINKKKKEFSIIAPIAKENNFGNFTKKKINKKNEIFEVDYVKGFAMLFDKNKIKKNGMFDDNIFLYLEEIDLCKRLREKNEKIYICKKSKITHLGAKSSDIGFEYEKCRNWHWMWSSVYFDKKFYNNFYVYKKYIIKLLKYIFKIFIFVLLLDKKKITIFYLRFSGILNSLMGKKSWYRPSIK
jgi:N-acetylglucosaminyl-diphospho-decaprenol L-rhamnosyltransferase